MEFPQMHVITFRPLAFRPASLSCCWNDFCFAEIFARRVVISTLIPSHSEALLAALIRLLRWEKLIFLRCLFLCSRMVGRVEFLLFYLTSPAWFCVAFLFSCSYEKHQMKHKSARVLRTDSERVWVGGHYSWRNARAANVCSQGPKFDDYYLTLSVRGGGSSHTKENWPTERWTTKIAVWWLNVIGTLFHNNWWDWLKLLISTHSTRLIRP